MSLTQFTLHPDIGKQSHVHLFSSVAATRFTSAAADVETEPSGFIAAQFGFG